MAAVTTVTDETFEAVVLNSDKPVLVDFWAAWCVPCRMVAPELEQLAEKYDGTIDVVKLDTEANPVVSQALGIMSLPTVALFRKGQSPMARRDWAFRSTLRPSPAKPKQLASSEYPTGPTPSGPVLRPRPTPSGRGRALSRGSQDGPQISFVIRVVLRGVLEQGLEVVRVLEPARLRDHRQIAAQLAGQGRESAPDFRHRQGRPFGLVAGIEHVALVFPNLVQCGQLVE